MTKWKCTVCDFIAEGEEAPDICPVCGAPKSAFVKMEGAPAQFDVKNFLRNLHLHPISSHFQNGLLPVAILFLVIYFIKNDVSFERAAFYVYTVAIITVPLTFGAGVLDWYLRYDMVSAKIFKEKIILSILLMITTFPILLIRFLYPDILPAHSQMSWMYIGGIVIQTGIVVRLGYLGGKLVFS